MPDAANTAKFKKLVSLLRELFQLDQPDLDFGIYRIMHAKAGEITQFLERDLLPQVKEAFVHYQSADSAALKTELEELEATLRRVKVDPDSNEEVIKLRQQLKGAVDIGALENETYDHLFSFFRRYYSEGDFLAKRVYKPGVYAIPYEGEEVTLHWANKDQYYIKTSEYLRDYAFRLRPDDAAKPMRVHFKLVDAAEGEHGNVKAAEGKNRVFVLAADDFIAEQSGDLELRFEYRPATLADWPEDDAEGKSKPPAQKELIAAAAERILAVDDKKLANWLAELGKAHIKSDGERADYSRLEAHLRRYSARSTFDYFIHKDLGGFLRRELDFYIKNEVMHLDDIESETAPKVEQYLSKIKVIRKIAGKIIEFLAQLENFQKKLWLKKKFVTETSWCITLRQIPETFYPEIAANQAQYQEWVELFAIDSVDGTKTLLKAKQDTVAACDFLKTQPTLVVDTQHFDAEFTSRLLEALGDIDEQAEGVLVHSDNFQALTLMQSRYREQVGCTYIDPPYNTGDDGFPYKDSYQHSTWLTMLVDRLKAGRELEMSLGTISVSIDDIELDRLCEAVRIVYGPQELAKLVWDRNRKNDARYFSVGHEYMLVAARDRDALAAAKVRFREPKDGIDEARDIFHRLRREHEDDWTAVRTSWLNWFDGIPVSDPRRRLRRYTKVGPRGPYRDDGNINWPGGGGPRYEVLHPTTNKPCRLPVSGWRYPSPERFWDEKEKGRISFGDDETTVPSVVSYLFESNGQVMPSVHYSYAQTAAQEFDALFGKRVFDNPKNWRDIQRLVRYLTEPKSITLDYFAGSGTTGHAIIDLNREDGGNRKFMLIEMGDYFDSVMLPRLKKVTFTPDWKDGKPGRQATREEAERSPRIIKVVRLESYEDTLNNLALKRTGQQNLALEQSASQGPDKLKEQYLLRYQLDVESKGSQSLLNIAAFTDPTAYKLKVKTPGSDESREVNVDLLETFNYLIGLTVQHMAAPRSFSAKFERDSEDRLQIKGRLKQIKSEPHPSPPLQAGEGDKRWWFRTVTGTTPDGRKALVIWRKLTGDAEQDNLVLDTWFRDKQAYSVRDTEFDLIWVNGDSTLENLRVDPENWKVRLIEEDFQRLMFEGTEA